ncbi:hypothetical protein F7Q99_38995 [Streptomyces kaniharaensis]|uniref:Uncharacterized protein n=1 Tax=Streptomyces kaniharaensis TaxID=212423 RepID=A0A6N7L2K4_9ACTN|nr:hypothetical protein [Streptomyces kaniharaensis]MQS18020.1 hypothetical protein [Streptomyces kaniharaensis]
MNPSQPTSGGIPDWLLAHAKRPLPQAPVEPELPQMMSAARWVLSRYSARILPVLTTTTVLILARIWNEQGAVQDVGDAVLMGTLSGLSAAAGTVSALGKNGHGEITATAYGASASLALTAVAAYTPSWPLALLMWVLSTAAVYALAAPHWRAANARAAEHRHEFRMQSLRSQTEITTTAMRVTGAVEVADRLGQLEQAWIARRALDVMDGQDVSGDVQLLEAVSEPKALGAARPAAMMTGAKRATAGGERA